MIPDKHPLLPVALSAGVISAYVMIVCAYWRVPGAGKLNALPACAVLTAYLWAAWRIPAWLSPHSTGALHAVAAAASIIFAAEIVLEYALLPKDNSRWGVVEFGAVFALYAVAAAISRARGGTIRAAARDAAYVAVICSLAWFVVVMAMYQAFLGTGRQHGVFLAEGDLDDFRQSFPSGGNFDAFMVEDFMGAGFFHLLLGPALAAVVGVLSASFVSFTIKILGRLSFMGHAPGKTDSE